MRVNDHEALIDRLAAGAEPRMREIRRDLHAHPELSMEERRTAGVVAAELRRLGVSCREGVGGTGVVGEIVGGRPGPVIAIRADMDALPIQEETGLPFASQVPGAMHACGHDLHTATLLGAAGTLAAMAEEWPGTLRLVFQPGEEVLLGARAMITDGALDGVHRALGFHNQPALPAGEVEIIPGASMAGSESFSLRLRGRSGHAAYPHLAVDPVAAAAQLITQAQTLVSREADPLAAAVITFATLRAGSADNIIPESCVLGGTLRALSEEMRAHLREGLLRLCEGIAHGLRVTWEIEWGAASPPLVNDAACLDGARSALRDLGDAVRTGRPSMGAEDFAFFAERVPSAHVWIGSGAPGRRDALHNAAYQPDESCMALGVRALCRVARAWAEEMAP